MTIMVETLFNDQPNTPHVRLSPYTFRMRQMSLAFSLVIVYDFEVVGDGCDVASAVC